LIAARKFCLEILIQFLLTYDMKQFYNFDELHIVNFVDLL